MGFILDNDAVSVKIELLVQMLGDLKMAVKECMQILD